MKTIQPIYKNIIATIVAIIIALVSIFAVAPLTKSYKFHSNSIQALDNKKVTVTELTRLFRTCKWSSRRSIFRINYCKSI